MNMQMHKLKHRENNIDANKRCSMLRIFEGCGHHSPSNLCDFIPGNLTVQSTIHPGKSLAEVYPPLQNGIPVVGVGLRKALPWMEWLLQLGNQVKMNVARVDILHLKMQSKRWMLSMTKWMVRHLRKMMAGGWLLGMLILGINL